MAVLKPLTADCVRAQLSDVSYYISFGPISDSYFHQPAVWLHERLRGEDDEGNPVNFTPEEAEQFRGALLDIAERLRRSAENLKFKE